MNAWNDGDEDLAEEFGRDDADECGAEGAMLDALRRATAPRHAASREAAPGGPATPERDAFLAFGDALDLATEDFDWRRLAARLEAEIVAASTPVLAAPRSTETPRRGIAWLAIASAALLLLALTLAATPRPEFNPSIPDVAVAGAGAAASEFRGIDSWTQIATPMEHSAWNDDLDLELAAAQRALRQGRDPWMADEARLSHVSAQIGDLTAGLLFESF